MIPKKIHYCWFGGNPLPDNLIPYIDSWKKHCPDWELCLWDENSFDISSQPFVKSAYEAQKYAFVSDYVRAWALYNQGGVYLDTDVELKRSIDEFLVHGAFSGFETKGYPFTAVWGASKGHRFAKLVLNYYDSKTYDAAIEEPNTVWISDILVQKYGIDPIRNTYQVGRFDDSEMHIYPSTHFCLDLHQNYATHHFHGSWVEDKDQRVNTKDLLHSNFYFEKYLNKPLNNKDKLRELTSLLSLSQIMTMLRLKLKTYFKP